LLGALAPGNPPDGESAHLGAEGDLPMRPAAFGQQLFNQAYRFRAKHGVVVGGLVDGGWWAGGRRLRFAGP